MYQTASDPLSCCQMRSALPSSIHIGEGDDLPRRAARADGIQVRGALQRVAAHEPCGKPSVRVLPDDLRFAIPVQIAAAHKLPVRSVRGSERHRFHGRHAVHLPQAHGPARVPPHQVGFAVCIEIRLGGRRHNVSAHPGWRRRPWRAAINNGHVIAAAVDHVNSSSYRIHSNGARSDGAGICQRRRRIRESVNHRDVLASTCVT